MQATTDLKARLKMSRDGTYADLELLPSVVGSCRYLVQSQLISALAQDKR